jgi:hypothetical protein
MKSLYLLIFIFSVHSVGVAQRSFDIQINSTQPALLSASAGSEPVLVGNDLILGGSPAGEGGSAPLTYQWLPEENLSDASASNPIFTGFSSSVFTLLVTDSRGCFAADTIQILITEMSDALSQNMLKAFPNPGSGSIRVEAPKNLNLKNTKVSLVDAAGRFAVSESWNISQPQFLIDVSKLAKGQYTLVVQDDKSSVSSKIILQ